MNKSTRGFTIVELLIVIVVIAILAAISIVAYNGIQKRGQDSKRLSDMNQLQKSIEIYYAANGVYPTCAGNVACSSTGIYDDISLLVNGTSLKDPKNTAGSYGYYYARGFTPTGPRTFANLGGDQNYIIATRLSDSTVSAFSGWDNSSLNYLAGK